MALDVATHRWGDDTMPSTPLRIGHDAWRPNTVTPDSSSSTLASLDDTPITPPDCQPGKTLFARRNLPTALVASFENFRIHEHPQGLSFPHHGPSLGSPTSKTCPSLLRLEKKLGTGMWSNVWRGEVTAGDALTVSLTTSLPRVVAVKVPADKASVKVLRREASITAHIALLHKHRDFVVDFFGYEADHGSLVLEYLPLSLDQMPTADILEGDTLRRLTVNLVQGLNFLHEANVIHGDIKPANIRMRPGNTPNAYQPVYGDFSASMCDDVGSELSESVGTYDYMAPELFSVKSRSTMASDVYALGMTILYLTIGRSIYSYCPNLFVRRAMAAQGSPLEMVVDVGDHPKLEATKARPWIEGALRRNPEGRPSAVEWKQKLEALNS